MRVPGVLRPDDGEGQGAGVVDAKAAARRRQHRVAGVVVDPFGKRCVSVEHGFAAGFENAIETAQHDEGQDDLAVFRLLEVSAQQFGDLPDQVGERCGLSHRIFAHPRSRSSNGMPAPRRTGPVSLQYRRESDAQHRAARLTEFASGQWTANIPIAAR